MPGTSKFKAKPLQSFEKSLNNLRIAPKVRATQESFPEKFSGNEIHLHDEFKKQDRQDKYLIDLLNLEERLVDSTYVKKFEKLDDEIIKLFNDGIQQEGWETIKSFEVLNHWSLFMEKTTPQGFSYTNSQGSPEIYIPEKQSFLEIITPDEIKRFLRDLKLHVNSDKVVENLSLLTEKEYNAMLQGQSYKNFKNYFINDKSSVVGSPTVERAALNTRLAILQIKKWGNDFNELEGKILEYFRTPKSQKYLKKINPGQLRRVLEIYVENDSELGYYRRDITRHDVLENDAMVRNTFIRAMNTRRAGLDQGLKN